MSRNRRSWPIEPDTFPLIVLPGHPESVGYTSPQTVVSKHSIPARDRGVHAETLKGKLAKAWEVAGEREAVSHSTRTGVYVEFASAPGFELPLRKLENRPAGIRLLNVRTVTDDSGERSYATVFVPKSKSGFFSDRFEAYENEITEKKGRPKNEELVASLEDIRLALISAFWTDDPSMMPGDTPEYVEVWLATTVDGAIESFRANLADINIEEHPRRAVLSFPERSVLLVKASLADLTKLIDFCDQLAELRAAREPSSFFIEIENREQADWVEELLDRTTFSDDGKVSVCLLDCGVNAGHPLISPLIAEMDLHSVDEAWGTYDHKGHGTRMAGVSGYGDLHEKLVSKHAVQIEHRLESVKILPPPPDSTPRELWGDITAQGIARAEIQSPERRRVVCLAVTSEETRDRGKPTSWSAAIDQLAAGVDSGSSRLILVSAGNVSDSSEWLNYPESNKTNEIHDPAQSWNALTVGACTQKTLISSSGWDGFVPIAPAGGLSPFSTTSLTWQQRMWPLKPDVVFEGGNAAKAVNGSVVDVDDLQPLSTFHDTTVAHFVPFNMTSAATALAANFAASIWSHYPELWPETVRGLVVHSAEWTESMKTAFLSGSGKGRYQNLLRTCGYGVPNIERATRCLRNRLTLIAEATLQPYTKEGSRVVTKDLHFYELPWPKEALQELGDVEVEMRITLSYFIEPGPGEVGWKERYRYASHGLRFELNSPGESRDELQTRVNKQARDEDSSHPKTPSAAKYWRFGEQRDVGSIHSDVWTGTAVELAASNLIAVFPTVGWWKERSHLDGWKRASRYALLVTINSPATSVDIFTPVATQITIPVEIEASPKE